MSLEQRLPIRMIDYWKLIKAEKDIPAIELFNTFAIMDLWPKCIRISVVTGGESLRYVYEYIGAEIATVLGKAYPGDIVTSQMRHLPTVKLLTAMDRIVENPETLEEEGQFVSSANKVVKYRACLLPFGKSREEVTHFIVGVSWRTY